MTIAFLCVHFQEKERHQKALMEAKKTLQVQKEGQAVKTNNAAGVTKTTSLNSTRTLTTNTSENQRLVLIYTIDGIYFVILEMKL